MTKHLPGPMRSLLLALSGTFAALAFSPSAAANEQIVATVDQYLRTQTRGLPGKVSTSVGQLDPRTQLAPCSAMEPFTLPGGRLWGKSTVGVRCLGPANWTVYVPVQISVNGNYVVAARPLAAGQTLSGDDLAVRQGELTALPAGVLTDPAQGIGKMLKNGVGSNLPLRGEQLIAAYVIQQGQDVRLLSKGPGFSVSNEGKALNNASEGQIVRVRTGSGQTVSGVARPGGIVEVGP